MAAAESREQHDGGTLTIAPTLSQPLTSDVDITIFWSTISLMCHSIQLAERKATA
jgi:hypothetical protein